MAIRIQYNKDLTYDQWKLKRNESIGSSETGAICIGSPYKSALEIFYDKVAGAKDTIENIRMWLGKKTEPLTGEMWEYYDDSADSVVKNHRAGTPIKKGENRNITIFNSDYPGRSSTPDLHILPWGVYEGKGEGYCELKNTQSYVLKSYNDELPPDNVFQLCDQLIQGDKAYGEIFYFVDNSYFIGYPMLRSSMKNIEQTIIQATGDLWKRIVKAKPLYNQMYEAKRNYNFKLAAELDNEIQRLEPGPQNSAGYLRYLTERYKERTANVGLIKGTEEQLKLAKKHRELAKKIDSLEKNQRMLEIELKLILKENNAIDFGSAGKVTYYPTARGTRLFKNNIK